MSKKKKIQEKLVVLTKEEATKMSIPKYNPYQGGYGVHGKSKYDRNKSKRDFRKEVEQSASFNVLRICNFA